MSKLCPLFSGSKGNSYYIGSSGKAILIDAGRSAKQLDEILLLNGLDVSSIKAIFVTHEHIDHVGALRVFATRHNIEIYASTGTITELEKTGTLNNKTKYHDISEEVIDMGPFGVQSFHTSHDSAESLGFYVQTDDDTKISIVTDLGYVSEEVRLAISDSDVLVIESNHDITTLQNGPYPYELKRRILSQKGHLSNDACAKELVNMVKKCTKHILLGHLSNENNSPELALETSICELRQNGIIKDEDYTIDVSPVKNITNKKILF